MPLHFFDPERYCDACAGHPRDAKEQLVCLEPVVGHPNEPGAKPDVEVQPDDFGGGFKWRRLHGTGRGFDHLWAPGYSTQAAALEAAREANL